MRLNRKSKAFSEAKFLFAFVTGCLLAVGQYQPAHAEVVRDDSPQLEGIAEGRIREWRDPDQKPKAVAIAVHGLILHGGVYEKLAIALANQGFVVVAPDLRGYGRWCPERHEKDGDQSFVQDSASLTPLSDASVEADPIFNDSVTGCKSHLVHSGKISYDKSYADLKELVKAVRNHYPALPVYVIGESLGAGMALHVAADMPQSIDGLVLSSPAIKHRFYLEPRMVMDVMVLMASYKKQVDLVPYIKRFASEDQETIDTTLKDPLVRKKLSVVDLLKTAILIKSNINHAERIPRDMPVLIIQGDKDRMLKSNGVVTLLAHLKSEDQTVRWFSGKGHLLLETSHIMPEAVDTVSAWLAEHTATAHPRHATADKPDDLN